MTQGAVLITGAGGFVGGHLAAGLHALGYRVTALDRGFDTQSRALLAGVDRVMCDLAAEVPDLPHADLVIHAAALTTGPDAMGLTAAEHVTANMAPLLTMLRLAADMRPDAFVFLSSSGVFDTGDGAPDLTDADPATAQGPYSAAKRAGEELVPGALGGICETHILRLGYLYGPGEISRPTRARVSLLQDWIAAARAGLPIALGETDARRDWTYVPDLAPAIARIMAGPGSPRPRHLCQPVPVADSDLAREIAARHPGTQVRRVPAPRVKSPMRPSVIPALDGFAWTPLATGLDVICAERVAA
jgi:UDP-glucose 4-epimerase